MFLLYKLSVFHKIFANSFCIDIWKKKKRHNNSNFQERRNERPKPDDVRSLRGGDALIG